MHTLTKPDLDAMPFGNFQLSFPAGWLPTITEPTAKAIEGVYRLAIENCGLYLKPLRLIEVSADLPASVARWQRELSLPQGVSTAEGGIVIGKALSWGTPGYPDTARAVVVLDEQSAFLCTLGDLAWPKAALLHEFAHVHDDEALRSIGSKLPHPLANDFPAILCFMGSMIWSEYFAEVTAASELHDAAEYQSVAASGYCDAFEGAVRKGRQIVAAHPSGMRVAPWNQLLAEVSVLAATIGRAVGGLVGLGEKAQPITDLLVGRINECEFLRSAIADSIDVLTEMDGLGYASWPANPFNLLRPIVDLLFRELGGLPHLGQAWDGRLLVRLV